MEPPPTRRNAASKRVSLLEPKTPRKDPASIDRRGLIGVGELATPKWSHRPPEEEYYEQHYSPSDDMAIEEEAPSDPEVSANSPWTTDAVDATESEAEPIVCLYMP